MTTIRKGSRNPEAVAMLQELLSRAGHPVSVDGVFGTGTDLAVRKYQAAAGLVVDGIVGEQTWMKLLADSPDFASERSEKFLKEDDMLRAARALDVELAAVKAVTEVESSGQGFVGGKPKILFEGHVFWKRLKAHGIDPTAHRQGNEDILYPSWTREHYLGGVREHDRLDKARAIQDAAALESASWGLFQIMGYHAESIGYADVGSFVQSMNVSEGRQLDAFARFVDANDLAPPLRSHDWATFARKYNGKEYKKNRYDEKLERAYRRYAAAGST
jgi:hypothetical protein